MLKWDPWWQNSFLDSINPLVPYGWAFLVVQLVKNPPAMREMWVRSLGWGDTLEKGKATHSRILAWRTPWEKSRTRLSSFHFTSLHPYGSWRRKWQPIPVFLPGESHGKKSLESPSPWDRKESDMTEWLTCLYGYESLILWYLKLKNINFNILISKWM